MSHLSLFLTILLANLLSFALFILFLVWLLPKLIVWQVRQAQKALTKQIKDFFTNLTN